MKDVNETHMRRQGADTYETGTNDIACATQGWVWPTSGICSLVLLEEKKPIRKKERVAVGLQNWWTRCQGSDGTGGSKDILEYICPGTTF